MATTSIWRVKGWLGKVVIYVENPDKTENPAFYERQDTIKTLDKAAVAGERMKEAYVRTRKKAEHGVYSAESSPEEYAADHFLGGTETVTYEASTRLTSRAAKVFRRPGRTFPRQRSILNNVKLMQNSTVQARSKVEPVLGKTGPAQNSAKQTCRKSRLVKKRRIVSVIALRIRPASP